MTLFYRLLSCLWSKNRLSLWAYFVVAVATSAFLFVQARNADQDFNPLSLIGTLNAIFFVSSPILCREILYKFYQGNTHHFFAQLPVSPVKMRLYEHLCYFLLLLLPYLLIVPALLFMVYYSGLWSTQQVVGFLGFQAILWLFFANVSLFLVMTGRLCWYLFWGSVFICNLYIRYSKNYQLELLNFFKAQRVLYQDNPVSWNLILEFGGYCLLLYAVALGLSSTIDNKRFRVLHLQETRLTRGIFAVYAVSLIICNFYLSDQFDASRSEFSGLYLTRLDQASSDYWSSSVQLQEPVREQYQNNITRLNDDVRRFAEHYQLEFPPVHYQHNPHQDFLVPLWQQTDPDASLEIKFNFDNMGENFSNIERDVIVEQLMFLSRGWLGIGDRLIYLRGLAANWSWRSADSNLIKNRLRFLSAYPGFDDQLLNAEWVQIFQSSGQCLFDSLAMAIVQHHSTAISIKQWRRFVKAKLNLDHTWVPFHLLRDLFSGTEIDEAQAIEFVGQWLNDEPRKSRSDEIRQQLTQYQMNSSEIYPGVFQLDFHIARKFEDYQSARVHLFEHEDKGRQIEFAKVFSQPLMTSQRDDKTIEPRLMLRKQRVSGTISWYDRSLACRVYAPWKFQEL